MRPSNKTAKRKTRAATGRVILRFRLSSAPDHIVVYNVNALQTAQTDRTLFIYVHEQSRATVWQIARNRYSGFSLCG